MPAFYQALGFFEYNVGHFYVAIGWLVEGRGHHFGFHRTGHVGYFLGPLVDEQNDEVHLRVVVGNGVGHVFEQEGLTGFRLRHNQSTLSFSNRRKQIHNPHAQILRSVAEFEAFVGEERGEEIEGHAVADFLRTKAIDRFDAGKRKIFFAFFGRAHIAFYGIAGFKTVRFNLIGGHVYIVGGGEVVVIA